MNMLAQLPDGKIASCSDDHKVMIWDTSTGKHVRTLDGKAAYVNDLCVLGDGVLVQVPAAPSAPSSL